MRIIEAIVKKGIVKIMPETQDDLWILYNIIKENDIVIAKTTREVKGDSGGGSRRVPMTLAIKVSHLEFQPFTNRLRIRGIVIDGPEQFGVKGKHHTINVEPGSVITIIKEEWPSYLLKRLENSVRKQESILLAAIDYDEYAIGILSHQGLNILYEKSSRLPGKDSPEYQATYNRYLKEIVDNIIEALKKHKVKAIILGSPGFIKNEIKNLIREIIGDKVKIYLDSTSVGGISGLYELTRRDIVRKVLSDLEVIKARNILDEFMKLLVTNPDMIAYGVDDVEFATTSNAAAKIVVSESLLRSVDEDLRSRVERILREADKRKADIIIAPQGSEVEKQVSSLGGIIAILRFPLTLRTRESKTESN
ncbi:MAG: mRNA surveillance protein pelota [Thermoprotei archaeon]|nr:MAG: mRNA surveillance protein pelota [Thermoprotei archaeon]